MALARRSRQRPRASTPLETEVNDLIVKTSMIRRPMRFVLCCLFTIESSLARRSEYNADAIVTLLSFRNDGMSIGNRLITRRLIVLFRWAKENVVVPRRALEQRTKRKQRE